MMTKQAFMDAYEEAISTYPWTADEAKRTRFLASVRATLAGATTWNFNGPSTTAAWQWIGGKGKPTLKALRALPEF
jgi:hypothetical protein